jgi:short-subunit dehydrogenase
MSNSWVLVTGASSGFGEQLARQYAGKGHSLVLVDHRRLDSLQKLSDELRDKYRIDVVVGLFDPANVSSAIQLHERLGERGICIDLMVNDVGHELRGPFCAGPLETAVSMVRLDVASLLAVAQFLREM